MAEHPIKNPQLLNNSQMKALTTSKIAESDTRLSISKDRVSPLRGNVTSPIKETSIFSIKINQGKFNDFVNEIAGQYKGTSFYVCVANVHMLIEAYRDNEFANVVNNANLVTPDGKPLTWALKILYGFSQERVCGMDLLHPLLESASEKELPVFFYGGTPGLLSKTKEFIDTRYKKLKVCGFLSPPFRNLTLEEEDNVVNEINNSGARIVLVVLGCPKLEKWMAKMKGRINAVMIGIGGALPVFIGLQKRAPVWMQEIGFEWLFRLLLEPRRLFKRYLVTNTVFVFLLLFELLKVKLMHLPAERKTT
jgi:N-acetylglucosaminyldiphosphoundecaprenol N-acetyl-beta-D-mannosaminyltransferase